MMKTQASILPLVLETPQNTQYFMKVNAKNCRILIAVVASFKQNGFMRGPKPPTLNFRAVGVFGSPQDKFAFSVLLMHLFA